MKFDLDRTWKASTALLSANLSLLAILAGVFVFLPGTLLGVLIPGLGVIPTASGSADMNAVAARVIEYYNAYWLPLLVMSLLQAIGLLAMLALLKRRARPTVAEAMKLGVIAVVPFSVAQFLAGIAVGIPISVVAGLGSASGVKIVAIVMLVLALFMFAYGLTRFSLTAPVMSIEGTINPLRALQRSWALTRGNGGRILAFYLLLLIAIQVCTSLFGMIVKLIFALFGPQAELFGLIAGSALVTAAVTVLGSVILAAVHAQCIRPEEMGGEAPVI